MPVTVTIAPEPSGSVVARGADPLAASLLDQAGFAHAKDWHAPRPRLPASMDREEQAMIATHAAHMLRAARYTVELDPLLDRDRADPQAAQGLDAQVLALIDRIRGAESDAELADALSPLLHPDHGLLERVREALEAAGEQIADLDDDAYTLADRFGIASDFVTASQSELVGWEEEVRRIAAPPMDGGATRSTGVDDSRSAALSKSPAAAKASASRSITPPTTAPPAEPPRNSPSRAR